MTTPGLLIFVFAVEPPRCRLRELKRSGIGLGGGVIRFTSQSKWAIYTEHGASSPVMTSNKTRCLPASVGVSGY